MRPEDVISAFDEVREFIFGHSLGRDNPHASDMATAKRWIGEGLTFVTAVIVFFEQMSWMHEKFLRFGGSKDRSYLPASLKVFDENIDNAIRRSKSGGQSEFWENEISRWRSRCKTWLKKPHLWNTDQWGPHPFESGCRVPKEILEHISRYDANMKTEMRQST